MGKFSTIDSRGIPVAILAVACLGVGFWVGRATAGPSVALPVTDHGGKVKAPSNGATQTPVSKPSAPSAPPKPAGPLEYESMEFDTSPDFKNPQASFPQVPKIFFRIKLKDHRSTFAGAAKHAALSYQRLGPSASKNGPMRQLTDLDLKPIAGTGEVTAYREGLTFMGSPPLGRTSFQVFVNRQPVGTGAFTIETPKTSAPNGP